ncbi:MAG: hypothetical protein QOE25_470 [Actinomycetota bacterium]|nr:hypothetical protein [Actinomycetota bacterium]
MRTDERSQGVWRLQVRRWLSVLIGSVAFGAASLVTAGPAVAGSPGWISICDYSHSVTADPIVYPGLKVAGHPHDFYGNKTTNGLSTVLSLSKGTTTCSMTSDLAAYWAPSVIVNGTVVRPRSGSFYYQNITRPAKAIKPFPQGLKIIAGDAHALVPPTSTKVFYWGCGDGGPSSSFLHPVACGKGWVTVHVNFPDCWDGKHLDSFDHKSHMAYSIDPVDGRYHCPQSHPVPVPRLTYALEFPVHDGRRITLGSGPAYTMHADFINTWNQKRLKRMVSKCINANVDCGKPGTSAIHRT